jgi:hypothetical protein
MDWNSLVLASLSLRGASLWLMAVAIESSRAKGLLGLRKAVALGSDLSF